MFSAALGGEVFVRGVVGGARWVRVPSGLIAVVALILRVGLLFARRHAPRDSLRREFPLAILAPLVTSVLMLDGRPSRLDGALLLGLLLV